MSGILSPKRWEREVPRMVGLANVPIKQGTELHKCPHSRGRVIRYIGEDIAQACELVPERFKRES